MLFNSIDFAIFLPVVFVLYWFLTNRNLKLQNILIVAASYVFYGWWDWRFLSLILFSTLVDFFVGRGLAKEQNPPKRTLLLWVSILVNLGFLGFFKYYNFFLDNFVTAFSFLGMELRASSLEVILPVGISFYTFQTLSYSIDVYKRKLEPTQDFIAFAAFVSFFPQLVAGPIERATNLLPQVQRPRVYDKAAFLEGIRLIIYGFFLKVFLADSLAPQVNYIFENYASLPGGTLILGAVYFAFQIYGDFSGYSKIARGTAMLFGFNLMQNFDTPYFSRNIAEFWRRWHISLNTWFRDYLYIPLGGSLHGKARALRNILVVFLVSGFWHGANWTFIVWGAIHALFFVPIFLTGNNRKYLGPIKLDGFTVSTLRQLGGIISTFCIATFAWIFFRSESIHDAFSYLGKINLTFAGYTGFLWVVFIGLCMDVLIKQTRYHKFLYPFMIGVTAAAAFSTTRSEFIYFQF